jgi:hypothetical protein
MELNKKNKILKMLLYAKIFKLIVVFIIFLFFNSCTVSYKFNGASIDYTKTKSISISDFPNTAELIHPPLSQEFTETLRDTYSKQTRLQLLKKGGDMNLEGEITGYQLTPMAISADSYSAETKLTITIKVRFSNNKNPADDFDKTYTAYQNFDSNRMLSEVQDELMKVMVKEIADNIYNDTVAKW